MRRVALLCAALLAGASAAQPPGKAGAGAKPTGPMPVRAVPAWQAPASDEASAVGTLRADESVALRPEIAGRVAEIRFAEGQRVSGGALLVRLEAAELAAVVASSRAQVALEERRLARALDLRTKGFLSEQALDDQRTSLARARAKLAEDEARLARTEIRAPFAGIVGLRQVSEGAYVAAGTDIARLEKIDVLKLDFRLPEAYVARLRSGQAVSVAVDAFGAQSFAGTIYAIEPAVDEQTRTVLVRARVPNRDERLRPGMFARVQLVLARRANAVWVPEAAIVPRGEAAFVYRVADGKAEFVKVRTGVRRPGEVEIVAGLAAGDLVVTEGTQRIAPGMALAVLPAQPSARPAAAAAEKKG